MAVAILVAVISLGAIAAGFSYARAGRRARSFQTTRGTVIGREVAPVPGLSSREGRWGRGGGYRPKVTYTYVVDGVSYTGDRWSYAVDGLKRSVAESELAAVPDDVEVFYDPAAPGEAYLRSFTSRTGYLLIAGGVLGVVCAVLALVA